MPPFPLHNPHRLKWDTAHIHISVKKGSCSPVFFFTLQASSSYQPQALLWLATMQGLPQLAFWWAGVGITSAELVVPAPPNLPPHTHTHTLSHWAIPDRLFSTPSIRLYQVLYSVDSCRYRSNATKLVSPCPTESVLLLTVKLCGSPVWSK